MTDPLSVGVLGAACLNRSWLVPFGQFELANGGFAR